MVADCPITIMTRALLGVEMNYVCATSSSNIHCYIVHHGLSRVQLVGIICVYLPCLSCRSARVTSDP